MEVRRRAEIPSVLEACLTNVAKYRENRMIFKSIYDSKDVLSKNLVRMRHDHGILAFNFFPIVLSLPEQMRAFGQELQRSGSDLWIKRPCSSCKRPSLCLPQALHTHAKKSDIQIQRFIHNPLLFDNRKFDVNVFALVTCLNPWRIYLYEEGDVRVHAEPYVSGVPTATCSALHLQPADTAATPCEHRTLQQLWLQLDKAHFTKMHVWNQIRDVVIKTLISADKKVTNVIPNRDMQPELFRFRVMLDASGRVHLLSVLTCPPLPSQQHLRDLPDDILRLVTESDQKYEAAAEHIRRELGRYAYRRYDSLSDDDIHMLFSADLEESRRGRFERAFPAADAAQYLALFDFSSECVRRRNTMAVEWVLHHVTPEQTCKVTSSPSPQAKLVLATPALGVVTSKAKPYSTMLTHSPKERLKEYKIEVPGSAGAFPQPPSTHIPLLKERLRENRSSPRVEFVQPSATTLHVTVPSVVAQPSQSHDAEMIKYCRCRNLEVADLVRFTMSLHPAVPEVAPSDNAIERNSNRVEKQAEVKRDEPDLGKPSSKHTHVSAQIHQRSHLSSQRESGEAVSSPVTSAQKRAATMECHLETLQQKAIGHRDTERQPTTLQAAPTMPQLQVSSIPFAVLRERGTQLMAKHQSPLRSRVRTERFAVFEPSLPVNAASGSKMQLPNRSSVTESDEQKQSRSEERQKQQRFWEREYEQWRREQSAGDTGRNTQPPLRDGALSLQVNATTRTLAHQHLNKTQVRVIVVLLAVLIAFCADVDCFCGTTATSRCHESRSC
eukprot:TRINITY_DN2097_c0_g1_i5.p1 TRINITY_DN2097_c0_g1~~TRINITY_DN2097_c0_g1_i5.p1  ORF type:complete len:779 (+),score=113.02 TRINITY_DN2097_c0_g1_i5:205-2541(+)